MMQMHILRQGQKQPERGEKERKEWEQQSAHTSSGELQQEQPTPSKPALQALVLPGRGVLVHLQPVFLSLSAEVYNKDASSIRLDKIARGMSTQYLENMAAQVFLAIITCPSCP